ncbi:MAG: hypothetical protein ACTTH7_09720 [Treponema sp.]
MPYTAVSVPLLNTSSGAIRANYTVSLREIQCCDVSVTPLL